MGVCLAQHMRCSALLFFLQFGKQILSQQISGWGSYYLDYKRCVVLCALPEYGNASPFLPYSRSVASLQPQEGEISMTVWGDAS